MVGALLAQPRLVVWALFFGPLMAVALWETFHGRPRSIASGISTTIASALLVPVLWMAAREASLADISGRAWLCFAFLALYFSGTVPLVKSMVRERKTPGFVRLSVGFHAAALGVFLLVGALAGMPWFAVLMALLLAFAVLRAWWIPHSAAHGLLNRANRGSKSMSRKSFNFLAKDKVRRDSVDAVAEPAQNGEASTSDKGEATRLKERFSFSLGRKKSHNVLS